MAAQAQDYVGGLPAGYLLHEYQIERVLGHGGFGVTYLARDTMLQKPVAIKEYLPTDWAVRDQAHSVSARSASDRANFERGQTSFLDEARLLARFKHPNIVPIYRFFQANGTAYFVMEHVEGETLRALVKREGVPAESRIRNLVFPLLQGLDLVHAAGVLHRDIKPENILVQRGDLSVLIDFGAARVVMGTKSRALTSVLTAGYAPIEQYSPDAKQGPWTDIYALGAVLYYLVSGRKPLDSISRVQQDLLVPAAVAGQGRYTGPFLRAIDWALQVRPEERPRNIAAWRESFEATANAPQVATLRPSTAEQPTERLAVPDRRPSPASERASPGRGRAPLVAAFAAVATVVLGISAWALLRPQVSPPIEPPVAPARTDASAGVAVSAPPETGAASVPAAATPPPQATETRRPPVAAPKQAVLRQAEPAAPAAATASSAEPRAVPARPEPTPEELERIAQEREVERLRQEALEQLRAEETAAAARKRQQEAERRRRSEALDREHEAHQN